MRLSPPPRKELTSRFTQFFSLTVVGVIFFSGFLSPSAMAVLPFYAQDWGTQFIDWNSGELQFPESAQLIKEFAVIYGEGGSRPGDAAYFQNECNSKMVHYLGFTNMWFGDYLGYLDSEITSEKVKYQEDSFYHSTDPATFVGWRESATAVQLRWTKDLRFVKKADYNDLVLEEIPNEVENYILVRENLNTGVVVELPVGRTTTFTDTPDPGSSYSYTLKSIVPPGISQDGEEFAFSSIPVLIDDTISSGPHFWIEKDDYQENHYFELIGNIHANHPVSWPFKFHCSAPVNPDDCIIEVWKLYNPETYDPQNPSSFDKDDYSGLSYNSVSGELTLEISSSTVFMTDHGGIIYRLRYEPDGGPVEYFPEEEGTRKHFIWSSINNRVMGNEWLQYSMNVQGESWKNTFKSLVLRLETGVSPTAQGPDVAYDGIFMDSVMATIVNFHNVVKPYEFTTTAEYRDATELFINEVCAQTSMDVFANTGDINLLDRLASTSGFTGAMNENLYTGDDGLKELADLLWVFRGHPNWQNLFMNSLNFGTDEANRLQSVAAFLFAREPMVVPGNEKALFGYGNWRNEPAGIENDINIMPEQILAVGNAIGDPFANTVWPDAAGWAAVTDSQADFVNWLNSEAPGFVVAPGNGNSFAVREFEMIDGLPSEDNEVMLVWDLGSTPGQHSVTMAELFPAKTGDGPFYKLTLPLEEGVIRLVDGGTLETDGPVSADDSLVFIEGDLSIFFTAPLKSPEVADFAVNPLPKGPGTNPVLEIVASHWNAMPLESLVVDGRNLGWGSEIELTASNGDSIYSYAGPDIMGNTRIEDLPYIATGTDGLRRYGSFKVQIGALPYFSDKSNETGDLYDIGNNLWAATTLNVGVDLQSSNPQSIGNFGREDLFVTVQGEEIPAKLFKHTGSGDIVPSFNFSNDKFESGSQPEAGHRGIAVADFDNDGFEDLLVSHNSPGKTRLYWWNPELDYFQDALLSGRAIIEGGFPANNYAAAWGDYNQDGYVDLFLARYPFDVDEELSQLHNPATANANSRIYEARPSAGGITFSPVGADVLPGALATSASLSMNWLDIDGDNDLDILFSSFFGDGIKVLINSGYPDYSYSDETSTWMPSPVNNAWGSTLVDLDNDGLPDLITTSISSSFLLTIFKNGGPAQGFSLMATQEDFGISSWSTVATGDMDLNGFTDIIVAPYFGDGPTKILLNGLNGHGFEFNYHPGTDAMRQGGRATVVAHDWGNDGDPDLYLPHAPDAFGTDRNFFFLNGQNEANSSPLQNKMVRVCVTGCRSGAVDARVSVQATAGGPVRTAWARVSEGRGGQTSRIVVFGVPEDLDGVASGTVTWPNGDVTTHTFNVGSSLNFVSQALPSPLTSGTVTAARNIGPVGAELEFVCVAARPLADFQVELDISDAAAQCRCGEGLNTLVLKDTYPGVTVEVIRLGPGSFRHTLTLTEWCCYNNCEYPFIMSGKYGTESWTSGPQVLTTSTCGKKIPWAPHQD